MTWKYAYPEEDEPQWYWDAPGNHQIYDLTNRKDLERLMAQIKHENDKGFPKKYIILAHSNRENNRLLGEKLDLQGKELDRIKNAFSEVLLYVTISQTGTYETDRIVTNGVDYTRDPEADINWDEYEVYRG